MGLYVYAIAHHDAAPLPPQAGLDGAPLESVAHQELTAIVSEVDETSIEPTPESAWRHETVVEALMATRAILPVQFGTVLRDLDAVKRTLEGNHDRFLICLRRVRGRVELSVKVLWRRYGAPASGEDTCGAAPASGRAYIETRLAQLGRTEAIRREAEELAALLHIPLDRLADLSTTQVLPTPRLALSAAYLVAGSQVAAFQKAVEELQAGHPDLSFLCTGPWPPYSFVTDAVPREPRLHPEETA